MTLGIFFGLVLMVGAVSYTIDRWQHRDRIELRDATTGEVMGMTKTQYKRYVLALGTKDPRIIAKAKREIEMRKQQLKAQAMWKRT